MLLSRIVYRWLGALALGLAVCGQAAWAQAPAHITNTKARSLYEKAQEYQRNREIEKSIATWTQLNEKFPSIGEAYVRKGSLLRLMGQRREAYEAYREGLSKLPFSAANSADYQTLGELALSMGEYEVARDNYAAFLKSGPKTPKLVAAAQRQLANAEFGLKTKAQPTGPAPERLGPPLNTYRRQYFPVLTADNRYLVFTMVNHPERKGDENEDLLLSRVQADGTFSVPQPISPVINTPENEGAATISGDGKTLVFTACGRPDGFGSCDLYISRRRGNNWSAPRNLGSLVNSSGWDSQPSLSADGRTLYFSSYRNGGLGQEDIYVTTQQENGSWAPARNLGAPINTAGKDLSPFIHASGSTLYYATDGLVGMGGYDVYRCEQQGSGWGTPQNLGYPLNTHEDESSLFVSSDNRRAFCSRSSPRKPNDPLTLPAPVELYAVDVPASARARETSTYTQGRVFDAITKKPLEAEVKLYDLGSNADVPTQFVGSDGETGDYTVVLNEGRRYALYVTANNYLLKSLSFDYSDKRHFDPLTLDIYLDPVRAGRKVVLNNLFFDSNQAELKPESRTELNRLIEFMRRYRDVQIEISGHTDNVGTPEANATLSQRRAHAVEEYLAKHGISATRLRSRGYGETRPLVANDSDANRQQNRRIELRIL